MAERRPPGSTRHRGQNLGLFTAAGRSLLALRDDGMLAGSVSGGCIEADLIERVRTAPPTQPEVLIYGGSAEECHRFRLPCGGTLQLVLEPAPNELALQSVLDALTSAG